MPVMVMLPGRIYYLPELKYNVHKIDKVTLNISGMHCASCASNIENVLKRYR